MNKILSQFLSFPLKGLECDLAMKGIRFLISNPPVMSPFEKMLDDENSSKPQIFLLFQLLHQRQDLQLP